MNMDSLPMEKRIRSDTTLSPQFIPDEIVAEILCLLPVKTILQLRCVSKAWKTLVSDPTFVQKHLKKSSQTPYLLFTPEKLPRYPISRVKFFPVLPLLERDPSIIVSSHNFDGWMENCHVVGTCNGLLCLGFHYHNQIYWFCLWNPATRTLSNKLCIFQDSETVYDSCKFTFGCDISTGTYKVVALCKVAVMEARVLSLGDNCLRTIQYGSSLPVHLKYGISNGLHLNGTVNCLAIANAQQFVIVSFDLSTETFTQFLLPPGFDEVPYSLPALNVLMDCICFSHDLKESEFVIWQMKKFGNQKSWAMLFKINYFDIEMHNYLSQINTPLLPLYLSKNGDTLILANYEDDHAFIYNKRENERKKRVKTIRIEHSLYWFSCMDYVESLVSPFV